MYKEWIGRPLNSAIRVPKDIILFSAGVIAYLFLYLFFREVISVGSARYLERSGKKQIPLQKYRRAIWKVFCYTGMCLWGIYTLYGEKWMFNALGITLIWPGNKTPWQVNVYYIVETVYYIGSSITIFFEEKQSDFTVMLVHHMCTLCLIGFSYSYNFLRYGVFLMILHDIADPWMEAAKISVYSGHQTLGNILFLIFTLAFIIPRVFVYVFLVLIPGYFFLWEYASFILVPIWSLLLGLFLLNLYWSTLILRMLFGFLFKGAVEKDIRDIEKPTEKPKNKTKPKPKSKNKHKHK